MGWFAAETQMARHCQIPNLTRAAAEKIRIPWTAWEKVKSYGLDRQWNLSTRGQLI
jgi:hypothetical protein